MEILSANKWFSDLEIDDYNFNFQSQLMNSCNNNTDNDQSMGLNMENIQPQCFFPQKTLTACSSSSIESSHTSCFELRSVKQVNTNNTWTSSTTAAKQQLSPNPSPRPSISSASSSHLLSFGSATSAQKADEAVSQRFVRLASLGVQYESTYEDQKCTRKSINNLQGTKRAYPATRTPSCAQDHIIAERKRREKLSQRFVALTAIVPGLKKMDKASVLGDAIRYLKQLQDRVRVLEEQTKKRTVESAVFVKRSQVSTEDDSSSCNENSDGQLHDAFPEIEARISEKDVLIRIHVEKHKGFVSKIVREVENLHLSVVNSSALPFGTSNLDITIIAQMEDDFCITAAELVKKLRAAFVEFMRHA